MGKMKKKRVSLIIALFFTLILIPFNAMISTVKGQFTGKQIAIVLNGSESITPLGWTIMVNGLASAVSNPAVVPQDSSVELTVVQFGTGGPEWAWTAVPPTVITPATVSGVAAAIQSMNQPGGATPMADGVYLAWQEISGSANFDTANAQVINLATDGKANIGTTMGPRATSDLDNDNDVDAMDDVIFAKNFAVTRGLDEFDAEGIDITTDYLDWLKDYVVYPQPGYFAPPFAEGGWVRWVAGTDEFAATIGEKFKAIISCVVTFYTDPSTVGSITFNGTTYTNGQYDTFTYVTSGSATADVPAGYVFHHWEVTGNVDVLSTTVNPTTVTISCGGTLKAVFSEGGCVVTFYTDPDSVGAISFEGGTYSHGQSDIFTYGTSGFATANAPAEWSFNYWVVSGNVDVLSTTVNPTTVTISCGGTLKAVFSENVGGVWTPINKLELLAPWISLASLITVAAASVVYVRHRKKKR